MLEVKFSIGMRRDMKRLKKQGKDFSKLEAVLELLADGKPLPPKNRDHALTGDKKMYRECHIEPDWLLVYEINEQAKRIVFSRTGTHADLFE